MKTARIFFGNTLIRTLYRDRKIAGLYLLLALVIAFNLNLIFTVAMPAVAVDQFAASLQLTSFFCFGIINSWYLHRKNFFGVKLDKGPRIALMATVSLSLASLLIAYDLISDNGFVLTAVGSASAFVSPFLLLQAWFNFSAIPAKVYPAFQLTDRTAAAAETAVMPTRNSMQLQVMVSRSLTAMPNCFPVTTSSRQKLGKVFEGFIATQQQGATGKVIELTQNGVPFRWQFFERKWGGLYRRFLNPGLTLTENNLRTNARVIVMRVPLPTPAKEQWSPEGDTNRHHN